MQQKLTLTRARAILLVRRLQEVRVISAIGGALALCIGAFGACVWLEGPYDSCAQVEPGVSFSATFEGVLEANVGHDITLDEVAQFDWDQVFTFDPYTPRDTVEEKTGQAYFGDLLLGQVPENETLLAFMKDGAQICRLSWRWGWIEGRDPLHGYERRNSRFRVEKERNQTTPHLVPDAA